MITSSFDRLLNKVQLQDDLPPLNFEGFEELPGVTPGDVFDVLPITPGNRAISVTAPQVYNTNEELLEHSVMELTNMFNTATNEVTGLSLRGKLCCSSDTDIKHDLEVDDRPPIDLLHEHVNEYVIELDR